MSRYRLSLFVLAYLILKLLIVAVFIDGPTASSNPWISWINAFRGIPCMIVLSLVFTSIIFFSPKKISSSFSFRMLLAPISVDLVLSFLLGAITKDSVAFLNSEYVISSLIWFAIMVTSTIALVAVFQWRHALSEKCKISSQ